MTISQARKTDNEKTLKQLQNEKAELERQAETITAQREPLKIELDGFPVGRDCSAEQWEQRNQVLDQLSSLVREEDRRDAKITGLQWSINRLTALLGADKQIVASGKREQELTEEIERLQDSAERVRSSITDIQASHEAAASAAADALEQAARARAKATAAGDSKAGSEAAKAIQEATTASQNARQAKEADAPLLSALSAEVEAIKAQLNQANQGRETARKQILAAQVAKLEDEWDCKVQELIGVGKQLVKLGSADKFRDLKIPSLSSLDRSISYRDLLDDPSVLEG